MYASQRTPPSRGCRIVLFINALVFIAAVIVAFPASGKLHSGVIDGANAVSSVLDTFGSVRTDASSLQDASRNVSSKATNIANIAPAVAGEANAIVDMVDQVNSLTTSAFDQLGNITQAQHNAHKFIEHEHGRANAASWAWAGIALVFGLLLILSTLNYPMCTAVHKGTLGVGLIIFFLTWLITTFFIAAAYPVADFCVTPAQTLHNLAHGALNGGNLHDNSTALTVDYFLNNCPNNTASAGVVTLLSDASTAIDQARQDTGSFNTTDVPPAQLSAVQADLQSMMETLNNARDVVSHAQMQLSCETVLPEWRSFLDGVCTTGANGGLVTLFVTSVVASVFLTLTMLCSGCLCGESHPGYRAPHVTAMNEVLLGSGGQAPYVRGLGGGAPAAAMKL